LNEIESTILQPVGFYLRKFVTMHGPQNIKLDWRLLWRLRCLHRLETDNWQCTLL